MGTSEAQRASLAEQKAWTRFENCELPAHTVTISKPFLIGEFEITQKQWEAVMGKNPSAFKDENHPVDSVSWDEVQKFIEKLNEKNGAQYRLPTEAEWEVLLPRRQHKSFGSGTNDVTIISESLGDFAWFRPNSENRTHPVGEKAECLGPLRHARQRVGMVPGLGTPPTITPKRRRKIHLNTAPSDGARLSGRELVSRLAKSSRGVPERNLPGFKSQYVGFRLVRDLEL